MSVQWVACGTCYSKTEGTDLGGIKLQRSSQFLCGISPHFVSTGDMAGSICIREPSVYHVVSIRKREVPGNENEYLCLAAITLLGCCHLANFDLFSRCV